MNITLNLNRGEQHLIYVSRRKFPDCIKGYRVDVRKIKNNLVTLIDLNKKNIEKTFSLHKIIEVLDKNITEEELQRRVQWHRDHFLDNYKPLKRFNLSTGSLFFRKKCSCSFFSNIVDMKLGNYPADITRDAHIFSFIAAVLKEQKNGCGLSDCKEFDVVAKRVLPEQYHYDDEFYDAGYFKDCFNRETKKDYIERFKEEVEMYQEEIKDIKDNNELSLSEKKKQIEDEELEKNLRIAKETLAIVKKDLRGMLLDWFRDEFNRKHNTNFFYMLSDAYDILELSKIEGNELWM